MVIRRERMNECGGSGPDSEDGWRREMVNGVEEGDGGRVERMERRNKKPRVDSTRPLGGGGLNNAKTRVFVVDCYRI